jgi:hypothetical protein
MSHESASFSTHPGTQAMIAALQSPGPRPELAEHLQLFGQFVGSWDLDRTSYAPDGRTATVPGEWHFGWVLDGGAVQDVWICPPRGLRDEPITPPGEWGSVIRFYDARIDAWRATWAGPASGAMYSLSPAKKGTRSYSAATTRTAIRCGGFSPTSLQMRSGGAARCRLTEERRGVAPSRCASDVGSPSDTAGNNTGPAAMPVSRCSPRRGAMVHSRLARSVSPGCHGRRRGHQAGTERRYASNSAPNRSARAGSS